MLKILKLKKIHFYNLEQLLRDANLVEGLTAYPERIYISEVDFKKMRKEITRYYKKQYPYIPVSDLRSDIELYMLNLSPSTVIDKAIKPGYAIIKELENDDRK